MASATESRTPIPTLADVLARIDVPPERVLLFGRFGEGTVEDVIYLNDRHDRLCELVYGLLVEKTPGIGEEDGDIRTLAGLLSRIDVPPERVVLYGEVGAGTVEDVAFLEEHHDRLCELVDGILVEKAMGYRESRWAFVLGFFIESYLSDRDIGIVAGADGMMRLAPHMVRIPDISFLSYDRLPGRKVPPGAAPLVHPDLVVEIISPSNPASEMDRKLREYFDAGARLVWYCDPRERTVRVFSSADQMTVIDESGTLEGGEVLPDFRLPVRDWFARAERAG